MNLIHLCVTALTFRALFAAAAQATTDIHGLNFAHGGQLFHDGLHQGFRGIQLVAEQPGICPAVQCNGVTYCDQADHVRVLLSVTLVAGAAATAAVCITAEAEIHPAACAAQQCKQDQVENHHYSDNH